MSSQGDNKVSQLETPYVHKFSVDQQKRQVHIRQSQRKTSRQLKQQIQQLHDPEYAQQVARAKYNYSKKGETIYNLDN